VAGLANPADLHARLEVAKRQRDASVRVETARLVAQSSIGRDAAETAERTATKSQCLDGRGNRSEFGDARGQSHRAILTSEGGEASIERKGMAILETY
jgi:hypothetical protein